MTIALVNSEIWPQNRLSAVAAVSGSFLSELCELSLLGEQLRYPRKVLTIWTEGSTGNLHGLMSEIN